MATPCSMMCSKQVVKLYGRNVQVVSRAISAVATRNYSNNSENSGEGSHTEGEESKGWPDELLGPVTPKNHNFPLPGNTAALLPHSKVAQNDVTHSITASEILDDHNMFEKYHGTLVHFLAQSDMLDDEYTRSELWGETNSEGVNVTNSIIRKYFKEASVEIAIQDCPNLLHKDFAKLFEYMPQKEAITVITITQKSENDMSGWSENVAEERETLLRNFITTATEVSHLLRANNFWADFIDPCSGQAYFGPTTSSSGLFETDERYQQLGFQIEDLGCCSVITHKDWGSNVFVGCVVTTARKDHDAIKQLFAAL